jgi:hypothetical protein
MTEIGRIEIDALYSAKGHFEAASRWDSLRLWLGIPSAGLAATAAGLAGATNLPSVLIVTCSLLSGILTALLTLLDASRQAQEHHRFGTEYLALRNACRVEREIRSDVLPDRLLALASRRDDLNKGAPQIPTWAYVRAKRGIAEGEATYRQHVSE